MEKLETKNLAESNGVAGTTSKNQPSSKGSTKQALLFLGLIFGCSVITIVVMYRHFPELNKDEQLHIKLPRNIDEAKNLGVVLSHYKDQFYITVLSGFFMTYIFLQTFAIPGSIFLSILSGFLFPFPLALFLVCLCSAVGASFCYLLSYLVGRRLVSKYFPDKAMRWSLEVKKHRSNLLNYIIFLRITPFLPNWFINITSPVIDVPLLPFFIGTFLGVAPPSFIAIQAGTTLHQLTSSSDAITWTSVIALAAFSALALLPILFKQKLQQKMD